MFYRVRPLAFSAVGDLTIVVEGHLVRGRVDLELLEFRLQVFDRYCGLSRELLDGAHGGDLVGDVVRRDRELLSCRLYGLSVPAG